MNLGNSRSMSVQRNPERQPSLAVVGHSHGNLARYHESSY